eukprot:Skav213976  [mRNA]  locus=scaffold2200:427485:430137:- [translate_table: standard]
MVRASKAQVLGLITIASFSRSKNFLTWRPASVRQLAVALRGSGNWSLPDGRGRPVVVLIDGDHIGPPWFEAILQAAKTLGSVQASCFGAPHLAQRWKKILDRWDVNFHPVLRFQIPGTDPGFAEAFEDHFGRPYDEEEAEAVYSQVGKGRLTADFSIFVPVGWDWPCGLASRDPT